MEINSWDLKRSNIQLFGENSAECGYCKQGRSVIFGGLSSYILVEDYDYLMRRGWSRSGNYLYLPMHDKTCCPQYIIRLHAQRFQLKKSHRKVLDKAASVPLKSNVGVDEFNNSSKDLNPGIDNRLYQINITLEPASYSNEKYLLYKKYIHLVHGKEDVTSRSFAEFLVQSPLASPADPQYGTFHQMYRLSNEEKTLVAVGVLDRLPLELISVYCFYDPDYRDFQLGKYSVLKEIEYCQQNEIPYYYLGYYVHSCLNMKYKAEYRPADLLCPVEFTWHSIEDCLKHLDYFPNITIPLHQTLLQYYPSKENKEECDIDVLKDLWVFCHKECNVTSEDLEKIELYYSGFGSLSLFDLTDVAGEKLVKLLNEWVKCGGEEVIQKFVVQLR